MAKIVKRALADMVVPAGGGAVGIAVLQTFLPKPNQFHSSTLMELVPLFKQATRTRIDRLAGYAFAHGALDPANARRETMAALGQGVRQLTSIMGYSDTFFLLGAALGLALLAILLLRKADRLGGAEAH